MQFLELRPLKQLLGGFACIVEIRGIPVADQDYCGRVITRGDDRLVLDKFISLPESHPHRGIPAGVEHERIGFSDCRKGLDHLGSVASECNETELDDSLGIFYLPEGVEHLLEGDVDGLDLLTAHASANVDEKEYGQCPPLFLHVIADVHLFFLS